MKKRDLEKLGVPRGPVMDAALEAVIAAGRARMDKSDIIAGVRHLVADPAAALNDPLFGTAACLLDKERAAAASGPKPKPARFRIWGNDIDSEAIAQIEAACSLPIAIRGALMPDAHVGYGLPIGGVLAVRNAVIPYAVGVDIACRMKISVLDLPPDLMATDPARFTDAINRGTLFGVGATYRKRRQHEVMDRDWSVSPVTAQHKDLAWGQLGTSGSGNHFVEFGLLTVNRADFALSPGTYTALLSHSGSRGTGSKVADHYSGIAAQKHRELPDQLRRLAWLDLASREGQEYWAAMELMGSYASANHELIHRGVSDLLGARVLYSLENHHNFAWRETVDGSEAVVHRKGATPAGKGVFGIIPGSMGSPGFIVAGRGSEASIMSAAHGAGRRMSRSQARRELDFSKSREALEASGVSLISAGIDEFPAVYKDIGAVMAAQADLVEVYARFDPKIVKMARE